VEGDADRRDPHVGDSEGKRGGGWLSGPRLLSLGSAQEEKAGREREKSGPRALGCKRNGPRAEREEEILFQFFKFIFQMIFKSNLNLI
jgi:hypothetical protein